MDGVDRARQPASRAADSTPLKHPILSLVTNAPTCHERWPLAWRSPAPMPGCVPIVIGGGGHGLATACCLATGHGFAELAVPAKG
jgi:sarcosine oxidase subunit beta